MDAQAGRECTAAARSPKATTANNGRSGDAVAAAAAAPAPGGADSEVPPSPSAAAVSPSAIVAVVKYLEQHAPARGAERYGSARWGTGGRRYSCTMTFPKLHKDFTARLSRARLRCFGHETHLFANADGGAPGALSVTPHHDHRPRPKGAPKPPAGGGVKPPWTLGASVTAVATAVATAVLVFSGCKHGSAAPRSQHARHSSSTHDHRRHTGSRVLVLARVEAVAVGSGGADPPHVRGTELLLSTVTKQMHGPHFTPAASAPLPCRRRGSAAPRGLTWTAIRTRVRRVSASAADRAAEAPPREGCKTRESHMMVMAESLDGNSIRKVIKTN